MLQYYEDVFLVPIEQLAGWALEWHRYSREDKYSLLGTEFSFVSCPVHYIN
jgi:hypothetical protein